MLSWRSPFFGSGIIINEAVDMLTNAPLYTHMKPIQDVSLNYLVLAVKKLLFLSIICCRTGRRQSYAVQGKEDRTQIGWQTWRITQNKI